MMIYWGYFSCWTHEDIAGDILLMLGLRGYSLEKKIGEENTCPFFFQRTKPFGIIQRKRGPP